MSDDARIDILKGALLLEHRGKALYESVARQSPVGSVKDLFELLVREEEKHIQVLSRQFARVSSGEGIDVAELETSHAAPSDVVLSRRIVKNISGAGYEAAAIAAALEFEKNAVRYYTENAEKATSEAEKKLFTWLSEWEKNHMLFLARVDNELKEKIWYDNQFWPLD